MCPKVAKQVNVYTHEAHTPRGGVPLFNARSRQHHTHLGDRQWQNPFVLKRESHIRGWCP